MQAATPLSTIAIHSRNQTTKINLSDYRYLFHRGKIYFLNRKMPENSGNSLPDNKMQVIPTIYAYKSITDLTVR